MPGSGKSFDAKRELVNVFLATRDRIIVVDPMGEYSPLIKRLGGQVIEIAPDSPHHINPMDIDLSFDEENPMALKADFILSLMELIVGGKDGLQPVERTVIDQMCIRDRFCKPMRQSWNRWRSVALWGVHPSATSSKPEKRLPNRQRRNGPRRKSPAVARSVDLGPCWPEAERRRNPCHANGRAMMRPMKC